MNDPAISIAGLSFGYERRPVFDEVSIDIPAGRFCALLGPNGAGKSTLFALLTRLVVAKRGRVRIAGFDVRAQGRQAMARIGVVFQQPTLDPALSVRRNLGYYAALRGLAGARARWAVEAALDRLELRPRADARVRELNGGHRRRLEISRALMDDPAVLLLDEATVGLAVVSRREITDFVHALCERRGLSVLWATHLVDEIRSDDQLLLLHQGRFLAQGTVRDLTGGRSLADFYRRRIGADTQETPA